MNSCDSIKDKKRFKTHAKSTNNHLSYIIKLAITRRYNSAVITWEDKNNKKRKTGNKNREHILKIRINALSIQLKVILRSSDVAQTDYMMPTGKQILT